MENIDLISLQKYIIPWQLWHMFVKKIKDKKSLWHILSFFFTILLRISIFLK
jgi:hypothetical protein